MFTDTHCHLYNEYYNNIDVIINNAQQNSINRFIVSGCSTKDNNEVINIIKRFDNVYGVIGLHPEEALNYCIEDIKILENNLNNSKIIGIGEIGLDYHYENFDKEKQQALFRSQLELADKYKLPVVIHSREATEDTIRILKEYPGVKGVIHSFSGSKETAMIYIKMGYKLGINGVVTFKNSHLKDILKDIINNIVLETDSPYLTPHPYRGTQNNPSYIKLIANFICDYLNLDLSQLSIITNNNIKEIFDI